MLQQCGGGLCGPSPVPCRDNVTPFGGSPKAGRALAPPNAGGGNTRGPPIGWGGGGSGSPRSKAQAVRSVMASGPRGGLKLVSVPRSLLVLGWGGRDHRHGAGEAHPPTPAQPSYHIPGGSRGSESRPRQGTGGAGGARGGPLRCPRLVCGGGQGRLCQQPHAGDFGREEGVQDEDDGLGAGVQVQRLGGGGEMENGVSPTTGTPNPRGGHRGSRSQGWGLPTAGTT